MQRWTSVSGWNRRSYDRTCLVFPCTLPSFSHWPRLDVASTSTKFCPKNVHVEQCTHGEANFSHGSSSRVYLSKQKRFKTTKYEGMQVLVVLSYLLDLFSAIF